MKTSSFRLVVAFALAGSAVFSGASAWAQDASGARIGFVNTERVFAEANASKMAQAKLKQEFSGREQQLLQQGAALKSAVEQFQKDAPKMAETQRAAKERDLMVRDADFQKKRREFQEDLSNRKSDEMQRFVSKANKIVEQVAKQEKYDVILQEAAYINPRIDITNKVINTLNAEK